jgi:hypothetical protein
MASVPKRVVRCPHCSAQLRVSTKKSVIFCPTCKGNIDLEKVPSTVESAAPKQAPSETAIPSIPVQPAASQKTQSKPSTAEAAPQPVPAGSLKQYLKQYWRSARGGWFLPAFFALLVAVGLSFFKPYVGVRGFLFVAGTIGVLFAISILAFISIRTVAYVIRRQRVVDEHAHSLPARIAFASLVALIFPLGPLAIAEIFGPDEGLFAGFVPGVKEPQTKAIVRLNRVGFLRRLGEQVRGENEEKVKRIAAGADEEPGARFSANGDRASLPKNAANEPGGASENLASIQRPRPPADESSNKDVARDARRNDAILQFGDPSEIEDLAVILDCSASMKELLKDGTPKIFAAKQGVSRFVQSLPARLSFVFIVYGTEGGLPAEASCEDIRVLHPLSNLDDGSKKEIDGTIRNLPTHGLTPLAGSLRKAGQVLLGGDVAQGRKCGIVLISDGTESCGGDPVAEAANFSKDPRSTFGIHVIGVDIVEEDRKALEQIAERGNGAYYPAHSTTALEEALDAIRAKIEPQTKGRGKRRGPVEATTTQGSKIVFPAGDISFADAVVSVTPGAPGPSRSRDPKAALGKPDYRGVDDAKDEATYVALGHGGELILEFTDNVLIDGAGPDLAVFEIGPQVEPILVAISEEGKNWIDVGRVEGSTCSIDIAPFVKPGQRFRFVKLTDAKGGKSNGGNWPGADIDAVGAINTLPVR